MSVNEVPRWDCSDLYGVEESKTGCYVLATDYDAAIDGQRQMSRDIKFYRERSENLQAIVTQLQKDVYFWKSRYNEKCRMALEVNDLKRVMDDMNSSGRGKPDAR